MTRGNKAGEEIQSYRSRSIARQVKQSGSFLTPLSRPPRASSSPGELTGHCGKHPSLSKRAQVAKEVCGGGGGGLLRAGWAEGAVLPEEAGDSCIYQSLGLSEHALEITYDVGVVSDPP